MIPALKRSEAPCAVRWQCELTNYRHKGLHMTFNQTIALAIVTGILSGLFWLLRTHRRIFRSVAVAVFLGAGAAILFCSGLNMAYSAGIRDGVHLMAGHAPGDVFAAEQKDTYLVPMWFFGCLFLLGGADGAIAILETTLPLNPKNETKAAKADGDHAGEN